jgi:hypothetical protein
MNDKLLKWIDEEFTKNRKKEGSVLVLFPSSIVGRKIRIDRKRYTK